MVQVKHINAKNIFWPLHDKVQVPQKGQSANRTAQGCSRAPSEAPAALVAPWRCLIKYPINAPLSPHSALGAAKPPQKNICYCPGVLVIPCWEWLSRQGWAQVIAAVGRDEPVEKKYFFIILFFSIFFYFFSIFFYFSSFFTSYMMDELSKKHNLV